MPHLVAAPDKFRGTVSAAEAAAAAGDAARRAGWTADEIPMSDGGEGLLDALGGTPRTTTVAGPLARPVEAEWRMLAGPGADGPTAVIEMSRAAGRARCRDHGATTRCAPARPASGSCWWRRARPGARRIVIGCGGSATTDGGQGAYDAVGSPDALHGVELVVACDVTTPFLEAAAVFGPQKGATPAQVEALGRRLAEVAARYRRKAGVDVTGVPGAGAAGGSPAAWSRSGPG